MRVRGEAPESGRLRRVLAAAIAASGLGAVSSVDAGNQVITVAATVISNSNCSFRAGSASALVVPTVDPSQSGPYSGTAAVIVRCGGAAPSASYALSNNNGLYGSGPSALRMRHATQTTEFLAYSLSYPTSGTTPKNTDTTLTLTATVSQSAYQNAPSGAYADTITLTISP